MRWLVRQWMDIVVWPWRHGNHTWRRQRDVNCPICQRIEREGEDGRR